MKRKANKRRPDYVLAIELERARRDNALIEELRALRQTIEQEASAGRIQAAGMIAPLVRLEDSVYSLRRTIEYGLVGRLNGIESAIYSAAGAVAPRPSWPMAVWNRCVVWLWRRKFDRQAARRAQSIRSAVDDLPTCDAWGDPHK